MTGYPYEPTHDELVKVAQALARDPEVIMAEIEQAVLCKGGALTVRRMLDLADDLERSINAMEEL